MTRAWRTGFLLAGGAYVASRALGSERLLRVSKPLVVPLLLDTVLTSPRAGRGEKAVGVVGLGGGWIGDLVLMGEDRLGEGAAAFAVNQVAYQVLLWRRGARPRRGRVLLHAVPLAGAAWFGRERLRLVGTYGVLLALTSTLASDPAVRGRGLATGGHLFLLSDALILLQTLLPQPDSLPGRVVETAVAATYAGAQRLLVDGLFRA